MNIAVTHLRMVRKGAVMAAAKVMIEDAVDLLGMVVVHSYHEDALKVKYPRRLDENGSSLPAARATSRSIHILIQNKVIDRYIDECNKLGLDPVPEERRIRTDYTALEARATPSTVEQKEERPAFTGCAMCSSHGYVGEDTTVLLTTGGKRAGLPKLQKHTHYCTETKTGKKKIKHANDWNGTEWPTWCPLRVRL